MPGERTEVELPDVVQSMRAPVIRAGKERALPVRRPDQLDGIVTPERACPVELEPAGHLVELAHDPGIAQYHRLIPLEPRERSQDRGIGRECWLDRSGHRGCEQIRAQGQDQSQFKRPS